MMASGEATWDGQIPAEEYTTLRAQFRLFKAAKLRTALLVRIGVILAVWFLGGVLFSEFEKAWSLGDGLFFTAVTIATIGYGYTYPTNDGTKVFLVFYATLALAVLASLLSAAVQLYIYHQRAFRKQKEKSPGAYRDIIGATVGLVLLALLGSIIFASEADWPLSTGIYFVGCTIGTVGYGDVKPASGIGNFVLTTYIFIVEAVKIYLICAVSHLATQRSKSTQLTSDPSPGPYSTFATAATASSEAHDGVVLSVPDAPDRWAYVRYRRMLLAIVGSMAGLSFLWAALISAAEGWTYSTACYYVIVTITTVAYGDVVVNTGGGRLLVTLYITFCIVTKFFALYALQRYRFLQSELDKTGPVWVVDETAALCSGCSLPFGVVRRRHHCRHCGRIFCEPCSRWRSFIPKYGYKDEATRVCLPCYEQLRAELARSAPPPPAGLVGRTLHSAQKHWVVASVSAGLLFLLGAGIFALVEKWRFVDGFYFAAITLMTIGYGDLVVSTAAGKMWLIIFAFLGLALFTQLLSVVQKVSARNVQRSMQVAREQLIPLAVPSIPPPPPAAVARSDL